MASQPIMVTDSVDGIDGVPRANSTTGLPPDYPDLTRDGQRLARLGLVCSQDTPAEFVTAWDFFRRYYLMYEDAGFYDGISEPAPAHYEWAYFRARYRRNAVGAHRGSAKSTIITEEFSLMNLLTKPASKTMMILSTLDKVEDRFDKLMFQLLQNERIREDFGVLRPGKGAGIWNRHHLRLANRASLKGFSVTSEGLRGERPHLVIVDDPECDARGGSNIDRMVSDFEILLFKIILPMLRRKINAQIFWIGTPLSKKMFLWKVIHGEDSRLRPSLWNRRMYPIVDDNGTIFWPSEHTPEDIERLREEYGNYFMSEMMCNPGSEVDHPMTIDPIYNQYDLVHGEYTAGPLTSDAKIRWSNRGRDGSREDHEDSAALVFGNMTRIITVDYAYTMRSTSDYSVVHVLGLDRKNALWSLALWVGRIKATDLVQRIWDLGRLWQVRFIGIENIGLQAQLVEEMRDFVGRQIDLEGNLWVPRVLPVKYPYGLGKAQRLQSLEWRVRRGLLKLPGWLRDDTHYRHLYRQIEGFSPGLKDGGLEHDDAMDTMAMYQFVLKGAPSRDIAPDKGPESPLEQLRHGKLFHESGLPNIQAVDLDELPKEFYNKILETVQNRPDPDHPGTVVMPFDMDF